MINRSTCEHRQVGQEIVHCRWRHSEKKSFPRCLCGKKSRSEISETPNVYIKQSDIINALTVTEQNDSVLKVDQPGN